MNSRSQLCQRHRTRKPHPTRTLFLKSNIRRSLIQPYPHRLQFILQNLPMAIQPLLPRIQNNQNGVGITSAGDDFPSSTLAVGGPLDDSR